MRATLPSTRSPVTATRSGASAFTRAAISAAKRRSSSGPMCTSEICTMRKPSSARGQRASGISTRRTPGAASPWRSATTAAAEARHRRRAMRERAPAAASSWGAAEAAPRIHSAGVGREGRRQQQEGEAEPRVRDPRQRARQDRRVAAAHEDLREHGGETDPEESRPARCAAAPARRGSSARRWVR